MVEGMEIYIFFLSDHIDDGIEKAPVMVFITAAGNGSFA